MPCPQSTQYYEAIENLRSCVSDEELREGQPEVNAAGLPILWSGNFADVYKVHCPVTGNTWAVKCFTREVRGLRERYREISSHLDEARLPFMVDFRYVEPGIRVGAQWHPFLKMHWVEGLGLNQFVADYVDSPKTLKLLLALWSKLAVRLRQARVAHADLQHGNVLLVPMRETGQFGLKLIDYDGMYVPSLAGMRSGELGHPAYQHPQRLREGVYNPEVDRFSHLAIYGAVRCLTVGKRQLWRRFDNGDNLLFREVDFQSPGRSEVFQELWALGDPDAHALIGRLILATQTPLDRVPLLTEVVSNGSVRPLSHDAEQQVKALMDRGRPQVRAVPRLSPDDIISSWLKEMSEPHSPGPPSSRQRSTPRGMPVPPASPASPAGAPPWWGPDQTTPPGTQPSPASVGASTKTSAGPEPIPHRSRSRASNARKTEETVGRAWSSWYQGSAYYVGPWTVLCAGCLAVLGLLFLPLLCRTPMTFGSLFAYYFHIALYMLLGAVLLGGEFVGQVGSPLWIKVSVALAASAVGSVVWAALMLTPWIFSLNTSPDTLTWSVFFGLFMLAAAATPVPGFIGTVFLSLSGVEFGQDRFHSSVGEHTMLTWVSLLVYLLTVWGGL